MDQESKGMATLHYIWFYVSELACLKLMCLPVMQCKSTHVGDQCISMDMCSSSVSEEGAIYLIPISFTSLFFLY